jgi:hypothetical protein
MKLLSGVVGTTLLLAAAGGSHAEVRIANDRGGHIGRYVDRYEKLRESRETIIIDGLCASACTIVLGTIPSNRICVTPNANLAFHAAWVFGDRGRAIPNAAATSDLFSMYPLQVRRWIVGHGGLTQRMIFLRGRQLTAMYRPCDGVRRWVGSLEKTQGPASHDKPKNQHQELRCQTCSALSRLAQMSTASLPLRHRADGLAR